MDLIYNNLLTLILFTPVLAALIVMLLPQKQDNLIRWIAFVIARSTGRQWNRRTFAPSARQRWWIWISKGEDYLRFKTKYEIRPEVTLKKYRGLSLEKPVHTVTDAEVEAEVLHLRRSNSTPERVEKVTDTDTIVTADVQETDASSTPLIGKKTTSTRFHLYDETPRS